MVGKNKAWLAFDLGASSGRAILASLSEDKSRLEIQEVHRFKNAPYEKDGHWYWNYDAICNELTAGLQKACSMHDNIVSYSIDTWGVDYALFKKGKIVRDPFNYRDLRNNAALEEHQKFLSKEKFFQRNGIQPLVFNTIYQLSAHRKEFPNDLDGAKLLLIPDALHYFLTGEETCETTEASTGALLNPETRIWDYKSFEEIGLSKEILTKLVEPSSMGLKLRPEICKNGIYPIRSVKCCSHDTASAVLAVPVTNGKHPLYISLGTWALLGTEMEQANTSVNALNNGYTNSWGINRSFCFLVNIIGTWLLQETRRVWLEQGKQISFADMERMARESKSNTCLINPDEPQLLQPGDMPSRIREICKRMGYRKPLSDAEVVRCIYDSLVQCFQKRIEGLEQITKIPYDSLNILGGGTKDTFLMQLTANCTGKKVIAGPTEATAIGNVLTQMIADGTIDSVQAARELVIRSFPVKTYFPSQTEI